MPALHVHCSNVHNCQVMEATYGPSTHTEVKKMWYPHTMECYSAFKKWEILPLMTTWINLGGIRLSDIRHGRTKTLRCYLHGESKMVKLMEADSSMEVARGWEWSWVLVKGYKVSVVHNE